MIAQNTILAEQDTYITPENRKRSMLPPTPAFYLRMIGIVFSSAHRAKHGRYGNTEWVNSSIDILNSLESAGCRFDIRGMSVLSRLTGPVVFVANHMSTLETFVLPSIINPVRPCTFVIKPSLMDYPVFGHVMRSRHPIVVSRDNPRQDLVMVMEQGAERINNGTSVILFPQTTRTRQFEHSTFNSLGIKLARSAGVPILPIALKTDAWDNGSLLKDFGRIRPERRIHIEFGEAIAVQGNGREQHESVIAFVQTRFNRWQSESQA
jgi:1-acyl-sn-glycerol-3-phosphate acyltransferase